MLYEVITYNSRPRAAEVMASGDRFEVVRERESVRELDRGERTATFLQGGKKR